MKLKVEFIDNNQKMIRKVYTFPIRLYQLLISPLLGSNCRYTPTCSQYCIESINENGILRGTLLSVKRIARCHPFSDYGYDPVNKKK
tara:strand:+ start:3273 stop:3533 length:261 start_codon:yes stop_codon:yes gene_type:complete